MLRPRRQRGWPIRSSPAAPERADSNRGRSCASTPIAANPGLARTLGVLLKQDFQRANVTRIPKMAAEPTRTWRQVLFLCDEYQSFATVGEAVPVGRREVLRPLAPGALHSDRRHSEPQFATLHARRRELADAAPVVSNQDFLALSDDFSAHVASELCGKVERLKPSYALTEAGQQARVSRSPAAPRRRRAPSRRPRPTAPRSTTCSSRRCSLNSRTPRPSSCRTDGLNPHPPTYCYLKPHWLDPQVSYFDHLADGRL